MLETIRDSERAEAAYDRRMYRYKAHYSLDCDNGIENAILLKPQTPEMLLEEKQLREQLYAAVMALPEKQAKRIYAMSSPLQVQHRILCNTSSLLVSILHRNAHTSLHFLIPVLHLLSLIHI